MSLLLKQSTSTTVTLGPFLDKDDGVTPETGLSPSVRVTKNSGTWAARNSASAISHQENGYYSVPLDTTDTNTLGRLRVAVTSAATHLPVWEDFTVLPANVFDSIVSGSDFLQVDIEQVDGSSTAAADLSSNAGNMDAAISSLNDLSAAQVNTEVSDVLKTDTISELGAVPGATPTFEEAIMFAYMALRNRNTASSSQRTIQNNAGTTIGTASLTDSGSVFTKGKFA